MTVQEYRDYVDTWDLLKSECDEYGLNHLLDYFYSEDEYQIRARDEIRSWCDDGDSPEDISTRIDNYFPGSGYDFYEYCDGDWYAHQDGDDMFNDLVGDLIRSLEEQDFFDEDGEDDDSLDDYTVEIEPEEPVESEDIDILEVLGESCNISHDNLNIERVKFISEVIEKVKHIVEEPEVILECTDEEANMVLI